MLGHPVREESLSLVVQGAGLGGAVHARSLPKDSQMEIWPLLCPGGNLPSGWVDEASGAKNVGTQVRSPDRGLSGEVKQGL